MTGRPEKTVHFFCAGSEWAVDRLTLWLRRGIALDQTPEKCAKCNGRMEQGFTLENSIVSRWVPGSPKKSFLTGTKILGKKLVPIGSFRCESCGYLEFYARDEFAAQ